MERRSTVDRRIANPLINHGLSRMCALEPEGGEMWIKLNRTIQSISFALAVTAGTAAFAYDPVDCLNDVAKVDSEIIVGLATRLCSGAYTPEPVKCYVLVSKLDDGIPRGIAIDLCAGAVSADKTVACYVKAGTERNLNRGLSTTLCGAKKF